MIEPYNINAISFFTGAMGLDLGLERVGIRTQLLCENDKWSRKTITQNRPNITLLGDINDYSASNIRDHLKNDEVDLIVGGPPCQSFSTAGKQKGIDDDRGNVLLKFIELSLKLRPRYLVIENVRGLLYAKLEGKVGGVFSFILNKLNQSGYGVSYNLYNSANFGVPQIRERIILICHREGDVLPFLNPTHSNDVRYGLPKWKTIREAFDGIKTCNHVNFNSKELNYIKMLKEGQNWKNLPEHLQKDYMGNAFYSSGGKTGFLRRLSWDKPSCTLLTSPTMRATLIAHPIKDRPLSIEEYKRIQQFPDDWNVAGSIKEQYRQVGNAVPIGLGEAIGKCLIDHMCGISRNFIEGFPYSKYRTLH